ncbi:hypothetical protein CSC66_09410 [Pseudoxanthomonas kaohsiungensis]|nr:hypothetical protein CSC66_09410 [Pseudoxanthomonas kaohsiungensis]
MYGMALTMFFLISLVGMSMSMTMDAAESKYEHSVQSLAENVTVYMAYAKQYRDANPGFTGAVSDASLGLPQWYGKQESMQLFVSGGRAFIYLPSLPDALAFDAGFYIRERTQLASFGKKAGGQIISADGVVVSVPSQIPNGAFVFVN